MNVDKHLFTKTHNFLKQNVCDYTYFLCNHICLKKQNSKKNIVSFNSVSEFHYRSTSNFDVQGWQNIFLIAFKKLYSTVLFAIRTMSYNFKSKFAVIYKFRSTFEFQASAVFFYRLYFFIRRYGFKFAL